MSKHRIADFIPESSVQCMLIDILPGRRNSGSNSTTQTRSLQLCRLARLHTGDLSDSCPTPPAAVCVLSVALLDG
jgi:hypothetical protein